MARTAKNIEVKLPKSEIDCPMDAILKLLQGRWTAYILYVLCCQGANYCASTASRKAGKQGPGGGKRFGEIKRAVPGISTKVLTERLKMLTDAGVIIRDYKETIPPTVSYTISPRGRELTSVLNDLRDLACRWKEEKDKGQLDLLEK